jgi:hypothetical protein
MRGECSKHGREDKCTQYFVLENLKGRDHSEHQGIDGKIILEWIFGLDSSGSGKGPVGVGLVNVVMNLRVVYMAGNF